MSRFLLVTALLSLVPLCQSLLSKKTNKTYDDSRPHFFTSIDALNNFLNEKYEDDSEAEMVLDPHTGILAPGPVEFGTDAHDAHVEMLKSVNGFKPRNLYLRSHSDDDPYIYITNPIEARLPHPFVPRSDIKTILIERIQLQKDIIEEINRDKLKFLPRYKKKIQRQKEPKRRRGRLRRNNVRLSQPTVVTVRYKPTVHTLSPYEMRRKLQEAYALNNEA